MITEMGDKQQWAKQEKGAGYKNYQLRSIECRLPMNIIWEILLNKPKLSNVNKSRNVRFSNVHLFSPVFVFPYCWKDKSVKANPKCYGSDLTCFSHLMTTIDLFEFYLSIENNVFWAPKFLFNV